MDLKKLGFNNFNQKQVEKCQAKGFLVGRICAEHKESYKLFSEKGELFAVVSGRFRNNANVREKFPSVGDWVLFDYIELDNKAIIQSVLTRKSKFSRKVAGSQTQEQIIASNVDFAFIVCSLNYDFNIRRIERYLSLIWQSGATPVIVLTKVDLCDDINLKMTEVESVAFGVDIHFVNNLSADGIEALKKYFVDGKTSVLLGSSGVGKSSLINNLAKENLMKVGNLRVGIEKGRHTTTHKQMIILPGGGLIIDTPGIRELQLWDVESGVSQTFQDIEQIACECRFTDCSHINEPGCAIRKAIDDGRLDIRRFENYLKIQKEQEYLVNRQSQSAAKIEKDKWKEIHKRIKKINK